MESFKIYEGKKEDIKKYLEDFKSLVVKLGNIGLDVNSDISKLDDAINTVNSDILSIALIGAFSDGKTTTIAGWLEEVKDNMKISTDESSDELAIYHPSNIPDKCQIVDTPGLFGDKEKSSGDDVVKLSDITKKYISSAHIIFYIVDATNPLKDNHKETVKWILRDLGKLDSTVFIINKMDEVADLTDEDEFNSQKKIKIENVIGKLTRFADLTNEEVKRLKVVCISSNPQGRGLDFWLNRKDDYLSRSRIGELQNITNDILKDSMVSNLIYKTGFDVIKDTVKNEVSVLDEQLKYVLLNLNERKEEVKRIEEDLNISRKEILRGRTDFRDELNNYENDILNKIASSSPDTIGRIIELDFGNNKDDFGYKIRNKVESMSERYFNRTSQIVGTLSKDIENHINKSDKFLLDMGKMAGKGLKALGNAPINVIKGGVFAARDILGKAGLVIKFKPWGAVKLAGNIGKFAGLAGAAITLALTVAEKVQEQKMEEEFRNLKNELSSTIKDMFKTVYDSLRDDEIFIKTYAPQILEFEKIINALHEEINTFENQDKQLKEWKKEAKEKLSKYNIIDADFEIIS